MSYLRCIQDFDNCPFRVYDSEKKYPVCNFPREHARLIFSRQFAGIPGLVSRACDWIRKEQLRLRSIREISRKKTLDFLKNAQVGDVILCMKEHPQELKLLEKPLNASKFVSCQRGLMEK